MEFHEGERITPSADTMEAHGGRGGDVLQQRNKTTEEEHLWCRPSVRKALLSNLTQKRKVNATFLAKKTPLYLPRQEPRSSAHCREARVDIFTVITVSAVF